MRGCITLVVLVGSAMVAVTWLGVWVLVLLIAGIMYLALMTVGKALGWFGDVVKGPEIGEWEVFERPDQSIRQAESDTGIDGRRS